MPKKFKIDMENIQNVPYLYMLHELCQSNDDIRQIVQNAAPYRFFGSFWQNLADLRDEWYPELVLDSNKMQDIHYVCAFVHTILHKRLNQWVDSCLQKNTAPFARLDIPAVTIPTLWENWLTTTIQGKHFFPELNFSSISRKERRYSYLNVISMGTPMLAAAYFGFAEASVPLACLGLLLSSHLADNRLEKTIAISPDIKKLFQSGLEWHELMRDTSNIGRLIRCALANVSYIPLTHGKMKPICLLNVKPHDLLYLDHRHRVTLFFGIPEKNKLLSIQRDISALEERLYPISTPTNK